MDPLFADIGNSTIKIARLVNGSVERLSYTDHQSAPSDFLSSVRLLSNVGMSLTKQRERFGDCPSVHDLLKRLPLNLAYTHPKQLGQDRIAVMMAAWSYDNIKIQKRGSFAAIDFGSCVTTDIVDSKGKHMGGNIDLGLLWRLRAAHNFSENLPMVDMEDSVPDVDGFLANNTLRALDVGIVSGFLRQQINHIKICFEQYGVERVFLTGGQSSWIGRFLPKEDLREIIVDEDLVIRGLNDIFTLG
ncbi:MAG TPA: hypothetical protein DCF84_06700 [Bacteroidetes bacterium]|nr:hypothetical protein [Bacteroidota bacterium]